MQITRVSLIVVLYMAAMLPYTNSYAQLKGKCIEGNCTNGHGHMLTKSGEDYSGNFSGGRRSGTGTFKYSNGGVYKGTWINDLREGPGVFTFADGSVFAGRFFNDKGSGMLTQPNAVKLRGNLSANNIFVENRTAFNTMIANLKKSVFIIENPAHRQATAFVIGTRYIATNKHVMDILISDQNEDGILNFRMFDSSFTAVPVRIAFTHPEIDLVIFRINDDNIRFPYPVLELQESNAAANSNVFAIGGNTMSVKEGKILEYGRLRGDFTGETLVSNISSQPGDSGSPTFDETGKVAAIISQGITEGANSYTISFTLTGPVKSQILEVIR